MSTKAGRAAAVEAFIARRGKLGMTQEEVALKARVSARTVGNMESGGRWPIPKNRARLEEAVDWPSGHLESLARAHDAESPVIAPDLKRSLERLTQEQKDYVIGLLTRRREESGDV